MGTRLGLWGAPVTDLQSAGVSIVAPIITEDSPHDASGINILLTPADAGDGSLEDYNVLLDGAVSNITIASNASGGIAINVAYGNRTYTVTVRGNNSLGESADSNAITATSGKTSSQVKAETLTSFD